MTIHDIKYRTSETAPHFFDAKTLKFFGQTMRDFRVHKLDSRYYAVSAPIRIDGKITGYTRRIFDSVENTLKNHISFE